MLCRGSMEEKLNWAFTLYDINGDGVITKDEFTEIVASIYDMMGKCTDPAVDEATVHEHVNQIYEVTFPEPLGFLWETILCCDTKVGNIPVYKNQTIIFLTYNMLFAQIPIETIPPFKNRIK